MVVSSVSPERCEMTQRSRLRRHGNRVERLGHGADLVQLHEQGVGDALARCRASRISGIGDEHVVAHELHAGRRVPGQHLPAVPVPFGQPSSIEMIGYCRTSPHTADHLLRRRVGSPDFWNRTVRPSSQTRWPRTSSAMYTSCPALKPALPMASRTTSSAWRLTFRLGANPPSSPTPVEWPRPSEWRAGRGNLGAGTAAPQRSRMPTRHHHEFLEVDAAVGVRAAVQDVHHRHRQRAAAGRPPAERRSARTAGGRRRRPRRVRQPSRRRAGRWRRGGSW